MSTRYPAISIKGIVKRYETKREEETREITITTNQVF
jgi:hypothetical protein